MACRHVTEDSGLREWMPSSQTEIGQVPKWKRAKFPNGKRAKIIV